MEVFSLSDIIPAKDVGAGVVSAVSRGVSKDARRLGGIARCTLQCGAHKLGYLLAFASAPFSSRSGRPGRDPPLRAAVRSVLKEATV